MRQSSLAFWLCFRRRIKILTLENGELCMFWNASFHTVSDTSEGMTFPFPFLSTWKMKLLVTFSKSEKLLQSMCLNTHYVESKIFMHGNGKIFIQGFTPFLTFSSPRNSEKWSDSLQPAANVKKYCKSCALKTHAASIAERWKPQGC